MESTARIGPTTSVVGWSGDEEANLLAGGKWRALPPEVVCVILHTRTQGVAIRLTYPFTHTRGSH